jgi:uncharacterized protein (DUF1697 family)
MTRQLVAFLRAINVGGHNVRMAELRGLFEDLGVADVSTFIASGNVIFDARRLTGRRLEAKIEGHLHDHLGYEVATFVRSMPDLAAVRTNQPFPDAEVRADGHSLHVAFLRDTPPVGTERAIREAASDSDELALVGREIFWLRRTSMRDSTMSGARIERLVGGPVTARNMNTIDRILRKYGSG